MQTLIITFRGLSFGSVKATVDWEYFVGSKLAWAKYLMSFNFVKLAPVFKHYSQSIFHVFKFCTAMILMKYI